MKIIKAGCESRKTAILRDLNPGEVFRWKCGPKVAIMRTDVGYVYLEIGKDFALSENADCWSDPVIRVPCHLVIENDA